MNHVVPWISAAALSLTGCATSVDLNAIRSQTCTSGTYKAAVNNLSNKASAPLREAPSLALAVSGGTNLPTITRDNVIRGSALLNPTPGTAAVIPTKPAEMHINSVAALTNLAHPPASTDADVSAEDLKNANDARDQIHDLLTGIPLSSSNFITNESNLNAPLGSVGKSSFSKIGAMMKTLQAGGYQTLTKASADQMSNSASNSLQPAQKAYLTQEFNTARFLATYYWAYFRGGHILQVSVDTQSLLNTGYQDLQNGLDGVVANGSKNLTSDQKTAVTTIMNNVKPFIEGQLKGLSGKFCKDDPTATNGVCLLTQPLGNVSFVSRAGTSIQFSGESISIGNNGKFVPSTSKISMSTVGPQLTEVLWEATFDSLPPFVPATASSTACVSKLYEGALCLSKDTAKSEQDIIDQVDADATTAETTTAALTGAIIRGGWLFSLNNEAIAEVIETSTGEIARKTTEKLVYTHLESACANQAVHPTVTTAKTL